MLTLVLWDVDHTLIENGGVSKANYALAFQILVGRTPSVPAKTGGRTDLAIMTDILADNGENPDQYSLADQFSCLAEAGQLNRADLAARGCALPGTSAALIAFDDDPVIINSVLTGNIEENARVKLAAFGLTSFLDFEVGGFGADSALRADLVPVAQTKAARKYHFDPTRDVTILIGDTHRDVQTGLDGGARVIAVATGGESVAKLEWLYAFGWGAVCGSVLIGGVHQMW